MASGKWSQWIAPKKKDVVLSDSLGPASVAEATVHEVVGYRMNRVENLLCVYDSSTPLS